MRLARQQNDTAKIDDAYSQIASHYYRLRNTDSLKVVAYEYMDWCLKRGNINNRYTQWRQYIQLLTEKGLQDEAMRETGLLQKDADAAKSAFGMACSEMCIGYNHRVFSNNVKLCLEYYSSALKKFSDAGFYEDAYVVSLNINYYGGWPYYVAHNGTCEAATVGLEHGPDRCVTDRYHLCAQHAVPFEPRWFDYVQCMWMNIDSLKCHKNGFCARRADYFNALHRVHPMCAASSGVDGEAIRTCAESPRAIELQKASYERANQTVAYGFAPTFVDGTHLEEVPRWRSTVDMLSYGRKLLTTVCAIVESKTNNASALPLGCRQPN